MILIPTHLSPFVVQTSPAFCFSLSPSTPGRVLHEQCKGGKDSSFLYNLKKYIIIRLRKLDVKEWGGQGGKKPLFKAEIPISGSGAEALGNRSDVLRSVIKLLANTVKWQIVKQRKTNCVQNFFICLFICARAKSKPFYKASDMIKMYLLFMP